MRAPFFLVVTAVASTFVLTVPADAHPTFSRASYFQVPIYVGGPGRGYDRGGSVRLQVSPREAEVFVDGYFAGTVDDFDGVFQRLNIEPGEHEVLVYLSGYKPFSQRFYLQPGKSFNVRHTMEPLAPGESAPPRPEARPFTARGQGSGPGQGPSDNRSRGGGAGGRGRQGGAADGFGSLSLRVQPADAEVLIDGEPWQSSQGDEPLVVQLGSGTHEIEIRKEGYRTYLTEIPLGSGQSRTLNVSLTKQ